MSCWNGISRYISYYFPVSVLSKIIQISNIIANSCCSNHMEYVPHKSAARGVTLYQKSMVTKSSRFVILNLTFVAEGCHSLLWSGDTMFERSQRGYLRKKTVTVCYGQRPQDLKWYRTGTVWSPYPVQVQYYHIRSLLWQIVMDRPLSS